MKMALLVLLLTTGFLMLSRGQQRMIYYPRPYPPGQVLPPTLQALTYKTSQGEQTAYYLPPLSPDPGGRGRTWLLFGGNASLALDWLPLLETCPDHQAGFLLLDYPGYGRCQGHPSPAAILESAELALARLAVQLAVPPDQLRQDLGVMGHSLGAAAGLLYASHHPVSRLVLISPFTSLKDMAKLLVGPLLSQTLLHDYDNRARLREVLARQPALPITIFHGDHDQVVPVSMGRELAALSPRLDYREIAHGDHNYILVTAAAAIRQAMLDPQPAGQRQP